MPSVRPAVRDVRDVRVLCQNHILKLFSSSGNNTIQFFSYQTLRLYSDGNPRKGASTAGGYEKVEILDQYLALSRK